MAPRTSTRSWRCVSVYSDAPFSIGGADTGKKDELGSKCGIKPDGSCICWGYGKYPSAQNESLCIVLRVHNSLKRMERGMERQLKYLDTLMPAQVHEKMKLKATCGGVERGHARRVTTVG